MKFNRSVYSLAVAAALGAAALGASSAARAGDVYWSVGVSSPGVQLGVASAPPVLVQPVYVQPVYVQQRPVYVATQPVVYMRPAPVYVVQTAWVQPGRGWQYGHGRHERERFDHRRDERGHGHRD